MSRFNKITLVTVTDDHYAILLSTLIKSIEANLSPDYCIDFWVVNDGVSETKRTKIERSINTQITSIHWKTPAEIIPKGTRLPLDYSTYPINIYMRLFIQYFIPETVSKVLFMDVDMINCTDLKELWELDLDGHIAAAVQDIRVKTFDNHWGGILNYEDLGFAGDTKYFNSGLLLMDMEKWRHNNISEKALLCIKNHKKYSFYPDQYGLNVELANKWKMIDPDWNHFASKRFHHPHQIHFIGRKPIYKSYNNHSAYRKIFDKYLSQTDFKDAKSISETTRYLKKIKNTVFKFRRIF